MKIWDHTAYHALFFVTDGDGKVLAKGLSRYQAEKFIEGTKK